MPKISLAGPAELLTVLPFHLGFRPERSVVVACFHGVRLGLTARLDLVGPADAVRAAGTTLPTLVQEGPSRVVLVGFAGASGAADPVAGPADPVPLLDALRHGLEDHGVTVAERLVVRDGRWYGLDCDCCRPPGRPLPRPADVPAVAEYVAMGTAVLERREELAGLVEPLPPDDPHHDARLAAVGEWVGRLDRAGTGRTAADRRARMELVDEALGAWVRLVRHGLDVDPSPRSIAALVGPLVDTHLRDLVVSWLCPGFPGDHVPDRLATRLRRALDAHGEPAADAATAAAPDPAADPVADAAPDPAADPVADAAADAMTERLVLARVEQVCRATPEACAAPLLAATAAYAWWLGLGAHASFAADRALLVDPGQRLATLVRAALEHGVRPPRCA